MLNRRQILTSGSAALYASIPSLRSAAADDATEFYRGKTVRMLVGSPPGGGYDLYARMLAPHLAARINATVVVENRDGSGGLAASQRCWYAGRRPDHHACQLRSGDHEPDAATAWRHLGRGDPEVARQDLEGTEDMVRRRQRPLSDREGRHRGRAIDLVGHRQGRQHQRRGRDHFPCARAQVQSGVRLSRRRRHVARGDAQ